MVEPKILLVDDEIEILSMLQEALSMRDYKVITAENAEKALEVLARESVMVMFLDLNLPGMSGIDLCRRIRKDNQIAIINALTGYSNIYGLLECRGAGFDDFFIKPVSLKTLFKAVDDAFEKIDRWQIFEYDLT
ncbi:MAG: Transcriptional regulatory protein AfsQ1 [Syntrophus sp. PtaU1.Bin005]|jgi:DNA-binding response OmpR family regulator|uniref:response regulator n=1 Tax=Syntrophus TaxID=43773 RepID=UPI0009C6319C|nr:MAG: Transcriptional regulatory protein AfsQ1 [Syntrophus sp. PtaB.Bin138]OPY80622.1 MAG: Transcriptional regulatory protein AfsQ1 [Syntrophus sp. PtaU1.Bin005]